MNGSCLRGAMAFAVWVAGATAGMAQERQPYYGEGHDYLAKVSPVPSDPRKLAQHV